jgi:predicted DNA-binding transcriptional regulator AlpA
MAAQKTKADPAPNGEAFAEVLTELRAIRNALAAQGAAVLNREAAALYVGVSTATLDRLTSAGKLRSIRVSEGRVGWKRKALDAYLDALEEG